MLVLLPGPCAFMLMILVTMDHSSIRLLSQKDPIISHTWLSESNLALLACFKAVSAAAHTPPVSTASLSPGQGHMAT